MAIPLRLFFCVPQRTTHAGSASIRLAGLGSNMEELHVESQAYGAVQVFADSLLDHSTGCYCEVVILALRWHRPLRRILRPSMSRRALRHQLRAYRIRARSLPVHLVEHRAYMGLPGL